MISIGPSSPPKSVDVPQSKHPSQNEIDHFISGRLEDSPLVQVKKLTKLPGFEG